MDGKQSKRIETERPIAKPSFPLPMVFDLEARAEAPTLQRRRERAHFYRKQTATSDTPTYGFIITTEPVERDTRN